MIPFRQLREYLQYFEPLLYRHLYLDLLRLPLSYDASCFCAVVVACVSSPVSATINYLILAKNVDLHKIPAQKLR